MTDHPKLAELRPEFRPLVAAILEDLEAAGWQPRIVWAYRSQAQQDVIHAKGYGPKKVGYHNAGLAVDLIDRRIGWPQPDDPPEVWAKAAAFFLDYRAACDRHGVASYGWLIGKRFKKSVWNRWGLGFDPAHAQMLNPPRALRGEFRTTP